MPYVERWAKVVVWEPPARPEWGGRPVDPGWGIEEGGAPGQGLPGEPEYPDQGLPGRPGYPGRPGHGLPRPPRPVDPDWGLPEGSAPGQGLPGFPEYPDQGLPGWGGFPGRPGHPLPRPPRGGGGYPIVPTGDVGGHPDLPDLNMPGKWGRVRAPKAVHSFPAWIVDPRDPPEVEDDYEVRHPKQGHPGTWVTVLVDSDVIAWAWCPSPPDEDDTGEELPEVDPVSR